MAQAGIRAPRGLARGWLLACLAAWRPAAVAKHSCQYVGIPGRRPVLDDMVAVCPGGPGVTKQEQGMCRAHAVNNYCTGVLCSGRAVFAQGSDEISVSRCEEMCSNGFEGAPKGLEKGRCLGYVLREPYTTAPHHDSNRASCWLIPATAKPSYRWPGELHFYKSSIHGFGTKSSKKTFIKENCGCGTRYLRVPRPQQRTELALVNAQLENALLQAPPEPEEDLGASTFSRGSVKSNTNTLQNPYLSNATGREQSTPLWSRLGLPSRAGDAEKKERLEALHQKAAELQEVLDKTSELEAFEGIYDYLPLHIPHRIYKGWLQYLPSTMVKYFSGLASAMKGGWQYWESPVRITNAYKKVDLSAVIYKCMDKESGKSPPPEHWYLATRDQLEAHLLEILGLGVDSMEKLKEDVSLQAALFFNMGCLGYKLDNDGYLRAPGKKARKIDVFIDPASLSSADSRAGCFDNEEEALQVREKYVVEEILAHIAQLDAGDEAADREPETPAAAPELVPAVLLQNHLCEDLLVGAQSVLGKIKLAEKVVAHQNLLGAAWKAAAAADKVAGGFKKGFAWLKKAVTQQAEMTTTTTTVALSLREQVPISPDELLARTKILVEAMREIVIRIYAIKSTKDEQLKLFCAKEMLETVQEVGGIWPKISQNLAVRPDIVEDDFARSKLKETQSGNKNRGKEATLEYLTEADPKLDLGGTYGHVSILEFMTHDKFLSAGSVGQVDVFELDTSSERSSSLAKAFLEKHVPEDWRGAKSKFIVKTVFKDTEEQYSGDFHLMEIFFTKLKKYVPKSIFTIWDVLKNMESSIFDEFDLRKEARFTARGRDLLKEYTAAHLQHKGIRATTPVGLETSSKYVMIQTFAQGVPLKSYLERVKGQWDAIAAWRQDIYSTILGVFGYTSIRHGFFQADPHPGNWFWDRDSRTLSLIDWGGVEDWTQKSNLRNAHCTLARLYSVMGKLVKGWAACDVVVLKSASRPEISGEYRRSGISIYAAAQDEASFLMGHTYAFSYKHTEHPLSLSFDGKRWTLSREQPLEADPFVPVLRMAQAVNTTVVPGPDRSFFGLALDQQQAGDTKGTFVETQWEALDAKGKVVDSVRVQVLGTSAPSCASELSRTQAYQLAAHNLRIKLKTGCQKYAYIDVSSDPALKERLRTDPLALVCLKPDDKGKLVGRVGVPPKNYDLVGTLEKPVALKIPLTPIPGKASENGSRQGSGRPSRPFTMSVTSRMAQPEIILLPLLGEEAALGLSDEAERGPSASGSLALTDDGIGRLIAPDTGDRSFGPAFASGPEEAPTQAPAAIAAMGPPTRHAIYAQAQRAYALATSLFDSDVAEAALQALSGRQSLALFSAGTVPQEYTLFARCVVVFHGMVADVLRDNFLRLVPVRNLQWLLQSHADGFFETWHVYADEYIDEARDSCPVGPWEALGAKKPSAVEPVVEFGMRMPPTASSLELSGGPSSGFGGRGVAMWSRMRELREHWAELGGDGDEEEGEP